jgi:hypothetical protein
MEEDLPFAVDLLNLMMMCHIASVYIFHLEVSAENHLMKVL